MKNRLLCIALLCCFLLLTACGSVQYESKDYHFTLHFPEEMSVFLPGQTVQDATATDKYGVDADALAAFGQQGGVFYAVGEDNGVFREVTVLVQESTYTEELWQLKKEDTAAVEEFTDEIIESFNAGGVEVKQKGKFTQGKAYCVYVNVCNNDNSEIDSIYLATVYNGLQYSILYQCNQPLTDALYEEAHGIFDTFYIHETLTPPDEEPRDTTKIQAVLVILLLLIVAAVIYLPIRIWGDRRHKQAETGTYVPQFEDTLKNTSKKDRKP